MSYDSLDVQEVVRDTGQTFGASGLPGKPDSGSTLSGGQSELNISTAAFLC
jgi:hypothetical protein